MSLQTAITSALASVAGGQRATDAAPEDWLVPFVVFELQDVESVNCLDHHEVTNTHATFLCLGATKAAAITLRGQVESAIEADSGLVPFLPFRIPPPAEKHYEPETDQFLEITAYSFWQ